MTSFQPVIIIGAARSGTKLVRDLIALHPAVERVPYDVNYVWRLGNEIVPHDELSPEMLSPRLRQRIRRNFERYSAGAPFLVEKTVSNCLRVHYVHAVFPEAHFIHLVREGHDVVESAYRQWLASPDWRYILRKARTFPLTEALGYALSYAGDVFRRVLVRDEKRFGTWGPRYAGIDEDVASKDLLEVCAIQWARCVLKAIHDLDSLPAEQVCTIRYEEFVRDPLGSLTVLARCIGIDPAPYVERVDLKGVSQREISKGRRNLSVEQMALIRPHIQETLAVLGYL